MDLEHGGQRRITLAIKNCLDLKYLLYWCKSNNQRNCYQDNLYSLKYQSLNTRTSNKQKRNCYQCIRTFYYQE